MDLKKELETEDSEDGMDSDPEDGAAVVPVDQKKFQALECKVGVPVLSSCDPQCVISYLSELLTYLELDVIKGAPNPSRNRLLVTGWRGDALNKWSCLEPSSKSKLLQLPTCDFVSHFRGLWFPSWLMKRGLATFMEGRQQPLSKARPLVA